MNTRRDVVIAAALSALVVSRGTSQAADNAEASNDIVRSYIERIFNAGDLAAIDELVAEGFISHHTGDVEGREAFRQRRIAAIDQAKSLNLVATFSIALIFGDGEYIGVALVLNGNYGDKPITVDYLALYRVANGQITEEWTLGDTQTFLAQIA